MEISERIKCLCKNQGLTLSKLERNLGFGNGTVRNWDKNSPSIDKVQKVADYFNVSQDYLMFGFEKSRVTNLINAAKFGRTVEQFSKEVGINEDYMIKLCNGDISEPPSPEVLNKIMEDPDSKVLSDYIELMEAAGHYDRKTAIEQRQYLALGYKAYIEKTHPTLAAHRTNGYDDPLTEDEVIAVNAFLEAYRKGQKNKKD
ncbi:MAG: helix-turn-helix domain-containing protein [Ruminiclostridium sp.]